MSKDRFTRGWDGSRRHKGRRVGTLFTDQNIDGDVTLTPFFDGLTPIEQIDLLQDFIGLLEREHDVLMAKREKPQ